MSATDKHTDLTKDEQPRYDDVLLSLWPGGASIRVQGGAAPIIAAAVPPSALFVGVTMRGMGTGSAAALAIGLYLVTLLIALLVVPAILVLVPQVRSRTVSAGRPNDVGSRSTGDDDEPTARDPQATSETDTDGDPDQDDDPDDGNPNA